MTSPDTAAKTVKEYLELCVPIRIEVSSNGKPTEIKVNVVHVNSDDVEIKRKHQ